jgi:8-oxo-dGTP pyrophosphatase MutT (NUDIX family)
MSQSEDIFCGAMREVKEETGVSQDTWLSFFLIVLHHQ